MAQSDTKRPRLDPPSWPSTPGQHPHGISLPSLQHHPPPPGAASGTLLPSLSAPHHPQFPPPPPLSFARPAEHHHLHAAQHHPGDRRHYEPEPYPPMQDIHRPHPPSPARPPTYGPASHIEPMVKRDPGVGDEANLPQMRRPNSTSNSSDGLSSAHGPPGPPHASTMHAAQHSEERRQMTFDHAMSIPQSPAIYQHHPAYPPPPTPLAQPQYDPPHVYGPQSAGTENSYSPSLTISTTKKKAQRAAQACDMCRQLKAKCDEHRPCRNCKEKDFKCIYRDIPAKQTDRMSQDILEVLGEMRKQFADGLKKMGDTVVKIDKRVAKVEGAVTGSFSAIEPKVEPSIEDEHTGFNHAQAFQVTNGGDERDGGLEMAIDDTPRESSPELTEAQLRLKQAEEHEMEEEPGPLVDPGQPTMPAYHTTPASLLLTWPCVLDLISDALAREKIQHLEGYHLHQERKRGVLRIFGRGEGSDQDTLVLQHGASTEHAVADYDEMSDIASPSPSYELYGQVGAISPPGDPTFHSGVLHKDGTADFDETRVRDYVQSFKDNVLNIHPIMDLQQLDDLVDQFLKTLPPPQVPKPGKKTSTNAQFVGQSEAGAKRKRSPASEDHNQAFVPGKPGQPFRNVSSALVLVILAIGKLSNWKGRVPDVVRDPQELVNHGSPTFRSGVPASPSQGSPPGPGYKSQSHSSGLPSPKDPERSLFRRNSFQGHGPRGFSSMKRNLEVIPGLEYLALAQDIIGGLMASPNLKLVWVYIFTGLYYGQLGRVVASWSFISLASRDLQLVMQSSLHRLFKLDEETRQPEDTRSNLLAFAYWTCLQLESDILAELQMVPSGITNYEDRMPYPNMVLASARGYSNDVLSSYSAQLYLRKQLNGIHKRLYNPKYKPNSIFKEEKDDANDFSIEGTMLRIQRSLKYTDHGLRPWVPPQFSFADHDPPADNILAARLRAKYWGSQVILYRPFIKAVLEPSESSSRPLLRNPDLGGEPPGEWEGKIGMINANLPPGIDPRVVYYAHLGIAALVESTRAFHGLNSKHRLIITNIFGTAHAQWGNLLCLGACYKNPVLGQFIDWELLKGLFYRTLTFFNTIVDRWSSSSLVADKNILEAICMKLDMPVPPDDNVETGSSYSNSTSMGLPGPQFSPDVASQSMPPPPHARS